MFQCWRYLCFGVKEQHPLLADADHAGRGTAPLAHLLGQEGVRAKQRHGAQKLCKTTTIIMRWAEERRRGEERRREGEEGRGDTTHRYIVFWRFEGWGSAWQRSGPHRRSGSQQLWCSGRPGRAGTPSSQLLKRKTIRNVSQVRCWVITT